MPLPCPSPSSFLHILYYFCRLCCACLCVQCPHQRVCTVGRTLGHIHWTRQLGSQVGRQGMQRAEEANEFQLQHTWSKPSPCMSMSGTNTCTSMHPPVCLLSPTWQAFTYPCTYLSARCPPPGRHLHLIPSLPQVGRHSCEAAVEQREPAWSEAR